MHSLSQLVVSFAVLAGAVAAQVAPASVFSDHMVLQRDQPIAVWGTAGAGEEVTVSFDGGSATAKAGPDGTWLASLPAHAAGGPFELVVKASNQLTFHDVLVGEVWVCSGQSNMSWSMRKHEDTEAVLPESADQQLRVIQFPRVASAVPVSATEAKWQVAGPESLREFSAVAYGFGRHLRKALGVPIGLVHTSWGGTRAEAWTRETALAKHEVLRPILERWEQVYARYPAAKKKHDRAMADWQVKADAARAADKKPPRRPRAPLGPDNRHAPGRLHHGMIQPLVSMSFRGAIWYQGEANAPRAFQYRTLFPTLIRDWRDTFGRGQFPFLFVQLAAFERKSEHPHGWAELREAQAMALSLPNTGMACTIDLGVRNDIHPPHKLEVGRRLALHALAGTYGRDVVCSGPMLSHYTIEGAAIRLHFEHVGDGLLQKGDAMAGFEIATADGEFEPATAVIDGGTVVVRGTMDAPKHVRYAWRHWPEISLFNRAGLPAVPFRTDDRRCVTFAAR